MGSCVCADITLEFFIFWLLIAFGFGGIFIVDDNEDFLGELMEDGDDDV